MKDCSKDICVTYDLELPIRRAKSVIVDLSRNYGKSIYYNYPGKIKNLNSIRELNYYLRVAEQEQEKLRSGFASCLKEKELEKLESILSRLTQSCIKPKEVYEEDKTNFDSWVALNPYCVGYEQWERCAYLVFDNIGLDFTIEELKCNLALDIITEEISCNLLLAIESWQNRCDLSLEVTTELEKCNYELSVLTQETDCNFSLDTYVSIKECGLDFDFIKAVYQNNCSLELEVNTVNLVCGQNKYDVKAFQTDCGLDLSFISSNT